VRVRITSPAKTVVDCLQVPQQDRHRRGGRGTEGLPPVPQGNHRRTLAPGRTTPRGSGHAPVLGQPDMTFAAPRPRSSRSCPVPV
jgi:hypothetical protein